MKKIFKIFFEKVPEEEFSAPRKLRWKMVLPKSHESAGLLFVKLMVLLLCALIILVGLTLILGLFLPSP